MTRYSRFKPHTRTQVLRRDLAYNGARLLWNGPACRICSDGSALRSGTKVSEKSKSAALFRNSSPRPFRAGAGHSEPPPPTRAAALKPDPANWPSYSGSYDSRRFSALKQVTPANAHQLQAKWVYHMAGMKDLETVPLVMNGVMYISQFNRLDAIDARSGNLIWKYQRNPVSTAWQRGTAFYNNRLYLVTSDSHLLALDARNGAVIWDVKSDGGNVLAGGAPLIAHGKVIVSGNRPNGFIQAYDAQSGKYLWTWSPIPKQGDPALASWGGAKPEGMPIWVSGSYDPEQNLIFYGTGQPEPQWVGKQRSGDDLYSDSIVALSLDTGQMKWYFQNTPHDTHDYDSLEMPVLLDANYKGQPRKLLLQANRNGYYYVLDRTNGKFLQATPFVSKIDWTTGIVANGKASVTPGQGDPTVKGQHYLSLNRGRHQLAVTHV